MNKLLITSAALALTASGALAGGIDRSGQFLGPLFEATGETGSYVQLSFGIVDPQANRVGVAETDPLQQYTSFGFAFKKQMSDDLSLALIMDQPFGVDVEYIDGNFAPGSASISSTALTLAAKYSINENFSAIAGIRAQKMSGQVASIGLLDASSSFGLGYLAGIAYERPEIAMRIALTYNSAITNDFEGTENFAPTAFSVETPDSINLEFQTGIAENTLLFGNIRHAKWGGFNLTTPGAGTYANFDEDTTAYSIGVGRRFSDQLSAAASIGFEASGAESTTPLAPTTGSTTLTLAGTYDMGDGSKITGGITYGVLGDQAIAGTSGTVAWQDNSVVGIGVRFSQSF